MSMVNAKTFSMSQNYLLRKCHFERDQVPTQSIIKKTMTPALADVYFKSMTPKLKVVVGLEPPMKGGGDSWFIPPEDLLEGTVIMKPFKKEYMAKWNCYGLDEVGMRLMRDHHARMDMQKEQMIEDNNENWERIVAKTYHEYWAECSSEAANANTELIRTACSQFDVMYKTTITTFQDVLFAAATKNIKKKRQEMFQKMNSRYKYLLHQQSLKLYNKYNTKLLRKKAKLKKVFRRRIKSNSKALRKKLHDANLEKHIIIEKSKKYLECQNLACQVYVMWKEREECAKELQLSQLKHENKMAAMTKTIASKDLEIKVTEEKERKRQELNALWLKKVCHVVKYFQTFVSYCLKTLPEYADFFINVEKLMLLQLNEALEYPNAASSIFMDENQFQTPIPKPRPFYLFCDKSYEPKIDQNLCPKHCTAIASQMPVVVINKRCIYSACDNFEQFTDKIEGYIFGKPEVETDFEDNHDYSRNLPVKHTSSQQLLELKLESSLMQVLQQEIPNTRGLKIECTSGCRQPYCFGCSSYKPCGLTVSSKEVATIKRSSPLNTDPVQTQLTRAGELENEREPKWDNYLKFIQPKKCECIKSAKKHLLEHFPPYMRTMSKFDAPELLNYEKCSTIEFKALVNKRSGQKKAVPMPPIVQTKTKNMHDQAIQCSDQEFDYLCTCFSDDSLKHFLNLLVGKTGPEAAIDDSQFNVSASYLTKETKSFASDRAHSLRNLIEQAPEIKKILESKDCTIDSFNS